ncbi:MAG: NAD(P)H-dependent oxidoreductase subunit E [Planctomycetes bacterium]|nr:NAD(P)H-dependent oxidoreductase subunit E [Planctomycetota bacterium]
MTGENIDVTAVERIVAETGRTQDALVPLLQAVQEEYGYLPREALEHIAKITGIPPAAITGVATFYDEFRHKPIGRHVISVCHGTACHVKGAPVLSESLAGYLKIPEGEDTDPSGLFTIRKVGCLGCCSLAPVAQIDDVIYGHLTPEKLPSVLQDFLAQADAISVQRSGDVIPQGRAGEVRICLDSCCVARGTERVHQALLRAISETGARVVVKRVGCVIVCNETPLLEVLVPGEAPYLYARVRPEDVKAIILRHFRPTGVRRVIGSAVSRTLDAILTDEAWEPVTRYSITARDPQVAAVLDPQKHIATEDYGCADPTDLQEYVAAGGFTAFENSVTHSQPSEVIEEIMASGLRGRGGAGFPTGRKWAGVAAAASGVKYVVCNGDEGDPGAFMDRMLLESFPYRVIEGMAIAAFTVGARRSYIYIRSEYPFAVKRVREALERCRSAGFLGDNIFGSGMCLDISVMKGAGAFVCGEETALLASIEGRRSTPRVRPPYPSESGLWGRPTLVNNVETLAVVPWILRNGAAAFRRLGTPGSSGTKVFALAGKTVRGGLIEVPMGITVDKIVNDIGGGIAGGRVFKAVLIGGPSGGCLPAGLADTVIDYDALSEAGAIMGSGGLVVLDDSDCMVDIARYFLEFTQNQSCGKCTFCRIGTRQMLDILTRLCSGEGRSGDLEKLEDLARMVSAGSLCGLGKTAPTPVLSTLRYFRGEYEAHLEGRCPAGRCKALVTYSITDDCIGCTRCAQHCPADAIEMKPYEKHEIDAARCIRCGTCLSVCAFNAVKVE